jgi:hypothetical protein
MDFLDLTQEDTNKCEQDNEFVDEVIDLTGMEEPGEEEDAGESMDDNILTGEKEDMGKLVGDDDFV